MGQLQLINDLFKTKIKKTFFYNKKKNDNN